METEIKESLILLLNGIKNSDGRAVAEEMARLDHWVVKERSRLSPQLAHFLDRRSYAKALALLGGESPAAGACAKKTDSAGAN